MTTGANASTVSPEMKLFTRSLAAATVIGAFLIAPVFTRIPARLDRVSTAGLDGSSQAQDVTPSPALPPGWPLRVVEHLSRAPLPVEVRDLQTLMRLVETTARRFGLDPLTVLAVIRVESGFNPFAVSPAGSIGLMQLQVDTARDVASGLGVEWSEDERLFEPELNVLLGTCYLRQMIDRFGGLDLALAAFHAGPNRIAARNLKLGPASVDYTARVWNEIFELHETARF